jgi:large subunit ribosomal protein L7/L12
LTLAVAGPVFWDLSLLIILNLKHHNCILSNNIHKMNGSCRQLVRLGARANASRHSTYTSQKLISLGGMRQHQPVSSSLSSPSTISCNIRKWYHSSSYLCHLVHKDAAAAQPTEEELNETEDTLPEWQNPLHHKNPDMQKMFADDFEEGEEVPAIPLPPLETDPDKVVAPPHIEQLALEIVQLNLLELKELTDKIADHFGFDDAMMAASYGGGAAMAAGDGGGGEAPAEAEVKTIFDLKLVGFDAKAKIKVIKEVRAIAGLGLKEAKELVESAPKVIQKDLKQDKADELKAQLEAVGAEVEIV